MAKVLLLDGNSLTYRAFFALPTDMETADGQVTNAVFGFTSMLLNLINVANESRKNLPFVDYFFLTFFGDKTLKEKNYYSDHLC